MSASYRRRRSVIALLLTASSALFLIHFSDLVQHRNLFFQQNEIEKMTSDVDRGTCCLSSAQLEDVCGRRNCTLTCSDPHQPLIAELENDFRNNPHLRGDRAFFLETSGSDQLNFRQACTVESLAFVNPNLTVYVLFMGGNVNSSAITAQELTGKYNNIRLIGIDLSDYVAGTPLERWYHCNNWREGPYHVSHLSDGLRFLTLAKYGGYYFDLDVVAVRPVTYYRNFAAAENDNDFGSGAIHSDYKHPLMELAVKEFAANYRSDLWIHNGPALLMRVLKSWCKVEDLQSMDYVRCRGFSVLPKTSFCPVHYGGVKEFFFNRTESEKKPSWLTEKVIGVHTWNKLSYGEPIYKNSTQHYTWLAQNHCPRIFTIAPDVF